MGTPSPSAWKKLVRNYNFMVIFPSLIKRKRICGEGQQQGRDELSTTSRRYPLLSHSKLSSLRADRTEEARARNRWSTGFPSRVWTSPIAQLFMCKFKNPDQKGYQLNKPDITQTFFAQWVPKSGHALIQVLEEIGNSGLDISVGETLRAFGPRILNGGDVIIEISDDDFVLGQRDLLFSGRIGHWAP